MQLGGRGANFFFAVERMGEVKDDIFICLFIITSAEGAPGSGGNVPVGATPTASQSAADGGASSHLLAVAAEQNGQKKEKGKKIGANSLSGSPNFSTQGESRVRAFCSLVLSNAKVRNSIKAGQKRIPVGRFQGQATTIGAPQIIGILNRWGRSGEKKWRFCSRALTPGTTSVQSRETAQHPARAFADSNRPDKRSKQKHLRSLETIRRGSDKCRRPGTKVQRETMRS